MAKIRLVNEYSIEKNFVLFRKMMVKGDVIYIQEYDPVSGLMQCVFDFERVLLGEISSELYFELKSKVIKPLNP